MSALLLSCEKYGNRDLIDEIEDGTDAPEWAGGNNNNSIDNSNSGSGTVMGDDYGDLYVVSRNDSGVPYLGYAIIVEEVTTEVVVSSSLKSNGKNDDSGDDSDFDVEGIWYPLILSSNTADSDGIINMIDGEVPESELIYVQEVDFGRINIVRSPESVLDAALTEAIATLSPAKSITTDASGRLVAIFGDEVDWLPGSVEEDDNTIDSPRENMAIYGELMKNGLTGQLNFLTSYGFTNEDVLQLAASAYAAGSDKTGIITSVDEIIYVNGFMGVTGKNPVTEADALDIFSNGENAALLTSLGVIYEPSVYEAFKNYEYFAGLSFFNFTGFVYDRILEYGNKKVRITYVVDNGDGTGTVNHEELTILQADKKYGIFTSDWVADDEVDIDSNPLSLKHFKTACDDAIQVLEFIHEGSLDEYYDISSIEYIGIVTP